ncbi:MAG TPA: HEAT repeat domain-containing protein [Nitrospiraceae bacterium]|nr:HEAT repeat domain-containing protein [Nitrospiraceae bacterium]
MQPIKQLLALLDKTFKTTRTYGPNNPVAQKFFQQFYSFLTLQLAAHDILQFLVQRSGLYYKGDVVYQSASTSENLAFKLHADGIRELSFHKGLSQDDLQYFLDALWSTHDPEASDDDIVTRLWEKNLSTISFVTAEETIKTMQTDAVLTPQGGTFSAPVSQLSTISSTEAARQKSDPGTGTASGSGQGSVAIYDVSPEERQQLFVDMQAESARDHVTYLLDMLTAILASEQSPVLLKRLLDLFGDILDALVKEGNWKLLNTFVNLLHEAQELCPNLSDEHKAQLVELFGSLGRPDRIKAIETVLNDSPESPVDELEALFLMLSPSIAPVLCALLAALKHKHHRLMVCEVLIAHAKHNPQILAKGLGDPRWYVVRNLVYVIGKLGNEQLLKSLEPLKHHADVRVRKEVLRALKSLCPPSAGNSLIVFLRDAEETIRSSALKLLLNGPYTTTFDAWSPVVTHSAFLERSHSEKHAIFQAMGQTAGEACVPYWQELVTRRFWRRRRLHAEVAALAAEALGICGTQAAVMALRDGQRRFNRRIREACRVALEAAAKRVTAAR